MTGSTKARTKRPPVKAPAADPSPWPIAEETLQALGLGEIYSPVAAEPRWQPWPEYDACKTGSRPWAPAIAAHVAANGGPRLAVWPKCGPLPGEWREQLSAYRRAGLGTLPAAAPGADAALDKSMAGFNAAHDAQDASESEGDT